VGSSGQSVSPSSSSNTTSEPGLRASHTSAHTLAIAAALP
jgi:hypothetical protein